MRRRVLVALVVAVGLVMVTVPAGAAEAEKAEYTRLECVYAMGAPEVSEVGKDGMILHFRGFPYLGILADNGYQHGTNEGMVAIDLNLKEGTGSIRGTLSVRDEEMGNFDGAFSGHYKDYVWEGRGAAVGIDGSAGKLLKVRLQGLDPKDCPPLLGTYPAIDAAHWEVLVIDTRG